MKVALNILGMFIILGTAGACDLDTISLTQTIWQCLIGFACIAVGCLIKEREC